MIHRVVDNAIAVSFNVNNFVVVSLYFHLSFFFADYFH